MKSITTGRGEKVPSHGRPSKFNGVLGLGSNSSESSPSLASSPSSTPPKNGNADELG